MRQYHQSRLRDTPRLIHRLVLTTVLCLLTPFDHIQGTSPTSPDPALDKERAGEILERFVHANRRWLLAPSAEVGNYSYVFNRMGSTQEFTVEDPAKAPRPHRQGVTYYTSLHVIASRPRRVDAVEPPQLTMWKPS